MANATVLNLRIYWVTWATLLAVTVVMLLLDGAQMARTPFVVLMLSAMAVKATLIAGNFMHLRVEHRGITLTLVAGLFVCGLVLYVLIAPDAVRIHGMVSGATR